MPAKSQLDHVLVAGQSIGSGMEAFERLTGVRSVIGGSHPEHGTNNALASFGDSYLELIAQEAPAADQPQLSANLNVIDFAMRSNCLDDIASCARNCGLRVTTRPCSRRTPGGALLQWRLLWLSNHDFAGTLPFFISWGQTPHPSRSAPQGLSAPELIVGHPLATELRLLFEALGIAIDVVDTETPRLTLSGKAPNGPFSLTGDARGWRTLTTRVG